MAEEVRVRSRSRSRDRPKEELEEGEGEEKDSKSACNQDIVTVYVGNLDHGTTHESLATAFAREVGDVTNAIVMMDPQTSFSRGFGFVTFTTSEDFEKAMAINGTMVVDDRVVKISQSKRSQPHNTAGKSLAAKNNLDGGRGGSGRGRGHPGSGRGGRGEHRREYNVACDRSRDQYDVRSHYRRDHGGGLGLVRGEHCVESFDSGVTHHVNNWSGGWGPDYGHFNDRTFGGRDRGFEGGNRGFEGRGGGFDRGFEGGNRGFEGGNRGFEGGNRGFEGGNRGFKGGNRGFEGGNRGFEGGNRGFEGRNRGFEGRGSGFDRGSDGRTQNYGQREGGRGRGNSDRGERDLMTSAGGGAR